MAPDGGVATTSAAALRSADEEAIMVPLCAKQSYAEHMRSAFDLARLMAVAGVLTATAAGQSVSSPQQFLEQWGKAWESHDVDAIMRLHADDCVTVNRFGVIASGKDEIRRNVAWLHNGPFHSAHFAAPKLLDQRKVAPGFVLLHASWKNPSGRTTPAEDDLVMTVMLRDFGDDGWAAEEIDTHTVEPLAPAVAPTNASGG